MFLLKTKNLFLLLVLCDLGWTEKIFENTAKICETKCKCNTQEGTLLLSCKGVLFTLANWPDLVKNETAIEATFSGNTITRLEAMPSANVTLTIFYDHCNITELGTGLFESAVNVKFVDLSYNLIKASELHSDVFNGPYNNETFEPIALEHLNLAYNQIHSLTKNLFEHVPHLRWLSLEGNHFRVIDLHTALAFSKLTKLEYFNLANNNLMHLPENLLKPLASLNVLNLAQNEIVFVPLTVLEVGKTLKKLVLDATDIMEFNDNTFLGMTQLTELSAKNLKELRDIKTNAFSPLKNLRKIDLSGLNGSVIIIDDQAFGNISKLEELNLSHSNLKELPINLVNWTELRSLDLRRNQFYCECYLVNITGRLSDEIKRERDGPRCYDIKRHRMYEVYTLTHDVCLKSRNYKDLGPHTSYNMRIMRISLLVLSVMLLISAGVALWLWYCRMLNARQSRQYPFASSIIYNPVATNTNYL